MIVVVLTCSVQEAQQAQQPVQHRGPSRRRRIASRNPSVQEETARDTRAENSEQPERQEDQQNQQQQQQQQQQQVVNLPHHPKPGADEMEDVEASKSRD